MQVRWLTVLVTALATSVAAAQDVQYTTVTKVDLGGGMNALMRMAGTSEVKETAYIKGKKLRSDSEKQSTIFDLDNGRYIVLNHADRTYTSVPLADMARVATSAVRGATTDASTKTNASVKTDASGDKLKATATDTAGNKADFVVDLKVEPTHERRNINGNDAQRAFVTMETDVRVTPQGETQSQAAGKLIILMDTWNASSGPASDAIRAWEQAASKEVAAAAFGGKGSPSPAIGGANPQVGEAMKKAREEAQKIEGVAVKSTMHLVIVAPDQKFDRALAQKGTDPEGGAPADKPKSGLRGMIGRAMESKAQPKQEQTTEQQTQGTLAKVITEIRDVRTTSVPASMFEIPAGYREVPVNPPAR
jgi:hypothetical protein